MQRFYPIKPHDCDPPELSHVLQIRTEEVIRKGGVAIWRSVNEDCNAIDPVLKRYSDRNDPLRGWGKSLSC